MTAVNASGRKLRQAQVANDGAELRAWLRKLDSVDGQRQVAARYCPAAKAYYARLRKRKPAQVAKIALAHKLLIAVWALLRHGVCFDESVFARG